MRRKSERNKTKGSPEKKVEKPTRKSTRRRGKRSPSTSPEQENVEEAGTSAPGSKEPEKEPEKVQTRLQAKEQEQVSGETETEKVTPVEREGKVESPEDEEENNGRSVWKVARADASPGEIQKLKLCRQRNASEASSDASVSRKKSNKWQESGEGVAEEVDSADEQLVSCTGMRSGDEPPNDPSSSYPGQDSNEEVSDSKEILPETTSSANLSDDKPNIDQQGVSNEANTANQNVDSEPGNKPSSPIVALAPSSNGDYTPEENNTATTTTTDAADADATTTTITTTTTTTGTPAKEEKSVEDEKSVEPFSKEASVENVRKDSSTDDEDEDKEKVRRIDSSSDSNDETNDNTDKKSSTVGSSRASRRKHRNKYRDSSNSETPDSEDEPSRERKVAEKYGKEEEEEDEEEEEEETDTKDSREAKERSVSPKPRSNSVIGNTEVESDHCEGNKQKSEISNEKLEYGPATVNQTSTYKPAKVNLKRSFSTRMLMERTEAKREDTDTTTANETNNQDKENHNSDQQPKCVPRKRRWGTALSTDTAPSFSISTDSLKALVPGAKPLPINEVRLSKDDDEERERYRGNEKWHGTSDDVNENKVNDDGLAQKNGATKKGDAKMDNHIAARRKISIVKETPLVKSPSPPATKPTNILLIKNLVRPFTLNQIKELLSRTGTIVENGFWMDRIKSKCFVEYANEDQAFETRQALHGISWPVSNPKRLHVDYATKDDMELARELSKDQPIQRKTEPLMPSDSWQQEWGRDERTNATKVTVVREWDLGKEDGQQHMKEKEREKKEQEKKRRQRSRSPALEAHLPAPARKFKKKEDEPPPAKLLDDLFRKTKATPCIYWLPLTNEQIVVKEEMRRQHMAEHARRLEEMRRAERNRDGRRRRSPRK